jgi:hypothetical protein
VSPRDSETTIAPHWPLRVFVASMLERSAASAGAPTGDVGASGTGLLLAAVVFARVGRGAGARRGAVRDCCSTFATIRACGTGAACADAGSRSSANPTIQAGERRARR